MALKYANNNSLSAITALPASISGGVLKLLETQTASSSATISFTSNIDSTYDAYMFKFYNIHPATNNTEFHFNMSTDGSNYNVTKQTTTYNAHHSEGDATGFLYDTNADKANGTGFQLLAGACGNDNDQCIHGDLILYAPSSTTHIKNFISRVAGFHEADYAFDFFTAGYGNTTSAVTAVQFKFDSGNIDSGVIKLYGIS